MKLLADNKRTERNFDVGDWVFLKLRPHRQHSVVSRINPKLAARYYGPYQVLQRIGYVAYKLCLPESSKIHPVFHVSLLKKAVGDYDCKAILPVELEDVSTEELFPIAKLGERVTEKQGMKTTQVLIQWTGQPAEQATWEDMTLIRSQFPEFRLEDKPLSEEGGNVTAQPQEAIGFKDVIAQKEKQEPKE